MKNIEKNKRRNPLTARQAFLTLVRSSALRLIVTGLTVIICLALTVFLLEKDHIVYTLEDGKKIEDPANSSNIRSFGDALWWGFVTSTSTGYGDYVPRTVAGRVFGVVLMLFGITTIGVITGNIASYLVEKQIKEGRGLKELHLTNHFIICGWKRDMGEVLDDILEKNRSFLPAEIVLINMADPEEIENLKADQRFAGINFIHGDYIDERVLNRANLKKAKKVLIVADRLVKGSVQEVDSRTVMTVITIKSLSKTIYVCAEILDAKFERYLRFSNCDEIILSTEYNRSLIAHASAGSGISHVVNALLSVDADVSIMTHDIPKQFLGRTFGELFDYYLAKDRSILIGVLENTGNFHIRKTEAIREAQKTPDISRLVDNLKTVKTLIANEPVINPAPDYRLTTYSRAIIIEGRSMGSRGEKSAG